MELSAGAVIVRKKNDVWEVLLILDMNGNLTFPKGLVEEHENHDLVKTAEREAEEETGIIGMHFLKNLQPIQYFYTREGVKIRKTVQYFLFETTKEQTPVPQKEEGISEILWVPIEKALKDIGYPKTNRPILEEAVRQLSLPRRQAGSN